LNFICLNRHVGLLRLLRAVHHRSPGASNARAPGRFRTALLFNIRFRVYLAPANARPLRRRGLLAILALALGYAVMMQPVGWAQSSHYALVRAFSHGTAKIDPYQWETKDKSYYKGHFYSVKGPGLALLALPLYEGLQAGGGDAASKWAAQRARANA